jgi:soluble lytic murein transglycosylase-like protein
VRRWTIGGVLAVLLCVGLAGDTRPAPVEAGVDVGALIDEAAGAWGLHAGTMRRIAFCESRFFPGAVNPRSGASGVYQFLPSTWRQTPQGRAGASVFDPVANVWGAMWLMTHYGPGQWACK